MLVEGSGKLTVGEIQKDVPGVVQEYFSVFLVSVSGPA